MLGRPVRTVTPRKKKVTRWFYIDIVAALDPAADHENAIISVPEDRVIRENFGRETVLDLSTREAEFEALHYPVSMIFDWDHWQPRFIEYSMRKG